MVSRVEKSSGQVTASAVRLRDMKTSELRSLLKTWMKEHQKTATDVASMTGVSVRTVERFVDGETHPLPLVLKALRELVAPAAAAS